MAYVKGKMTREIFSNPNNGYMVGLFKVIDSNLTEYIDKTITFTGIIDSIKYKTNYILNGEFISHVKYGTQFKVDTYEEVIPTDEDELVEFLSSSIFPIGEKTAKKIVDKYGKETIDRIIKDPDCLEDIPRLSNAKAILIREKVLEYQSNSKLILELNKLGFSTKESILIMKKYGNQVDAIIDKNIYEVIDDDTITFLMVDRIALGNGYEKDDERRLLALTIYLINNLTFRLGDTYLYFSELYDEMVKNYIEIDRETFEYILMKLNKLDKIVIDNDRYYLKELYDAEVYISNRIYKMNELKRRKLPHLEKLIDQLEMINEISYDDSQKDAIMKSINNNLTIITGGPGTGKTTIIKCIVKLLLEINKMQEDKLALLAPTGRAARKLMEVTGVPAFTIHKYLKWDKDKNEFEVNEYSPNKEDYIIVDEASMVDTILMESLLKGIKLNAKIILVGDYYQLPSVSQGQILKDLIDSNCLDVVKLNCLYRQTEDSYIVTLANEIREKEINEDFMLKYDDYNFITCGNDFILEGVKDIVSRALKKGYDKNDIQVLAPIYKSINGIDNLNKVLQEIMNPESDNKNEIISGDVIYREGDKILQLVNDSDNSISNGDLGYIETIINEEKSISKKNEIIVNFFGNRVIYTPKDFKNITHGYAISVHKSQGGEFKMVIMPMSSSYKRMLYNKLLYTGITRAKEKLILIGEPNVFMYGVKNDYVENRKTGLRELIENKYNIF